MCALNTVNETAQQIVADGFVVFDVNTVNSKSIQHAEGSPSIILGKPGKYLVVFGADVTPGTTAGQLVLLNGSTPVPAADGAFAASIERAIEFATIIEVLPSCKCVDNKVILKVQATAEATVTNASMSIVKVM